MGMSALEVFVGAFVEEEPQAVSKTVKTSKVDTRVFFMNFLSKFQ
jgi:hypothetical protein